MKYSNKKGVKVSVVKKSEYRSKGLAFQKKDITATVYDNANDVLLDDGYPVYNINGSRGSFFKRDIQTIIDVLTVVNRRLVNENVK